MFEGMVAKLADFGFSALASKQFIRLGGSQPWVAPEYDRSERYTFDQAKLMDLYSFGMLCLWVVFKDELTEKGKQLPERARSVWSRFSDTVGSTLSGYTGSVWVGSLNPDIQFLGEYNIKDPSKNMMRSRALELVDEMEDSNFKGMLRLLFEKSLSYKPKDRSFASGSEPNFEIVARLLSGERQVSAR